MLAEYQMSQRVRNILKSNSVRRPVLPVKAQASGEALPLVYQRRVRCIAGRGGDGMVSFFRGHRHPFGGPDGGDGGNGGHVIFRASRAVGDLSHLRSELRAPSGEFGKSKSMAGRSAEHLEIGVPLGTAFRDSIASPPLCELSTHGQHFLASRGGIGGHGNQFYLSDSVRKPLKAEVGGSGEEYIFDVTMQVIAAAGLLGFPNAGKSSLLRAISRARPKVASYPFTTLQPHVGVVEYEDRVQISVADTPGILEGAHANLGLGHTFLGHISRCALLFYVIDASLGDVLAQRDVLRNELLLHGGGLAAKPSALLLNKIDIVPPKDIQRMCTQLDGPVFPISAKNKIGLEELLVYLRDEVDKHDIIAKR